MRHKTIILLIIILAGVFWQWWVPGPRVATDFSLVSQTSLKSILDLPQTWSVKGTEGLGEYDVFTLWSWPFNLIIGILTNLGFSFEVLERLLFVIPFLFIGSWAIKRLCEFINLSKYAQFISILFYLTTTYILLVIDGGQLTISLAYALFPLGFLFLEQAIYDSLKKKILAGLLISVIGIFDIRFIYIFILLSLIRFIYGLVFLDGKKRAEWIIKWLKTGFVCTLIILGLNAYWILILIKFPLSSSFYSYLTQASFTSFITLGHAIILQSPHWSKNVFGNVGKLQFEFILIPILVFLAPILRRKDRIVGFWLIVAGVSLFLTKGLAEPLPQVYQWFYSNIPGFSLFRDSSKFFFLVALSYSVLIGVTVDEITKRVKNIKIRIGFVLALALYLIVLIKPVWMGTMTGTFSQPLLQKEYLQLNKRIAEDLTPSNIFWIPTISPLTSLNLSHPAVEAVRLAQKRPFAQANLGAYERFNFLREAPYMGQLFDVGGIGYIAYPWLDLRRSDLHTDNIKYYYTFLNQLSNLSWLSRVESSSIPLFKVKKYQDKLFIAPNLWIILGPDSIYKETTKNAKLVLSKNALIFAEEDPGLDTKIDELPNAKIVLHNKTGLDLAASFIDPAKLIFPAKNLRSDPDESGWWKRNTSDLISWRFFLQDKYKIDNQDFDLGGGWAVGEKNSKFKIQNSKFRKNDILLARVMESSRSGTLKFYQDNQEIGEVSTKIIGDANVRWFEVGRLNSDAELMISSEGDINVVNALATVDKAEWAQFQNKASEYKQKGRIFDFNEKNTQEQTSNITYQQISPTKYKVSIGGLNRPVFLVFSQTFDNKWKLNDKASFPVYSLLNGFYIEKDGQYNLEFEPQKYVSIGLIISAITLVVSLALLFV